MTDRALARMLVENTGTHFLDSGGANGRAWQQNRAMGLTVDTLIERPEVTVTAYNDGDGYVTLDVFHYLRSKLEYRHGLTMGMKSFSRRAAGSDRWLNLGDAGAYAAWRVTGDRDADEEDARKALSDEHFGWICDYSYNHENLLSQDIQFVAWKDPDLYTYLVALQIHGGADARGGFTEPRIFELTTDEPWDLFEWHAYSVVCTKLGRQDQVIEARVAESVAWQRLAQRERAEMLPGMPLTPAPTWDTWPYDDVHCWDVRGPRDWITYGGSFTGDPYDGNGPDGKDLPKYREGIDSAPNVALCPCGEVAEVYTR